MTPHGPRSLNHGSMLRLEFRDSSTLPLNWQVLPEASRAVRFWELLYRCLLSGPFISIKDWFHSDLHVIVRSNPAVAYCCYFEQMSSRLQK